MVWPRPPKQPRFVLWFWFDVVHGATELVGFEMRSVHALWTDRLLPSREEVERTLIEKHGIVPRPLTSSDHRKVNPVGEAAAVLSNVRTVVDGLLGDVDRFLSESPRMQVELLAQAETLFGGAAPVEHRGQKGVIDRAHLEEVADVYARAKRARQPTTAAVQEHFAERWGEAVSKGQARKWVWQARHDFPGDDLIAAAVDRVGGGVPLASADEQEDER